MILKKMNSYKKFENNFHVIATKAIHKLGDISREYINEKFKL